MTRPPFRPLATWLVTGVIFRAAATIGALGVGALCGALANLVMPETFATLREHTDLNAIQFGALRFLAASMFRELPGSLEEFRRTVGRKTMR